MKRIEIRPKERDLLSAAHASGGQVKVSGRDVCYSRSLAARGFGRLTGHTFELVEAGRAAWLAVRDSPVQGAQCDPVYDPDRPETWGKNPQRRPQRRISPLERLVRDGDLTADALTIMEQVTRGFQILTSGTGYRSVRYDQRVDCDHSIWNETAEEFEARLLARYHDFRSFAVAEEVPLQAVLDLLIYDMPFRVADRAYRRGTGWSRAMLGRLISGYLKQASKLTA